MIRAMKRIVVLVSGRGSNMLAIAQACEREAWSAHIEAVIVDRQGTQGELRARQMGLKVILVEARAHASRAAYEAELAQTVEALQPDLIVLAGYLRILPAPFVERWSGRVMNIHPSLLPAFVGLNTHQRALQAGVKLHGATVHYVVAELDAGPVIAQAALSIQPDDDESSLAARVLALEHRLYPAAVRWHCEGRLQMVGACVRLINPGPQEAQAWWDVA
jgi:phosphoribosylglycinamide formyltransferase-1